MRRRWTLVSVVLTVLAAGLPAAPAMQGQVALTTVQDTVYSADGTTAQGTVIVSWAAFTTANGNSVAAGSTSTTLGANGALAVALAPNAGANPVGSYYTAVFHLSDGTTSRQYWVVPAGGGPVTLATVENQVLPTSVALQTVSKSYVDNAIAKAVAGVPPGSTSVPYVEKAGDAMAGALQLPGDPVSALQAADKHYVDTSVAQLAGGNATKVSTVPTAAQTIAQPAGTQMEINSLNGVLDATGWLSGNGNNGFANALTSANCTGGCEVRGSQKYPGTEPVPSQSLPTGGHVVDARGGAVTEFMLNPQGVLQAGNIGKSVTQISTWTSQQAVAARPGIAGPNSYVMDLTQNAVTGGSNQYPSSHETVPYNKSNYGVLQLSSSYNTQGQHVQFGNEVHCYSVGDCLAGGQFIVSAGGYRDEADEGTHPFDLQVSEDNTVFQGTCASGCTTGSTGLTVNVTSAQGTQGDGRFLMDKNPAKVISTGALVGAGADVFQIAKFSGTNFPSSVFLAVTQQANSRAASLAPGTVTLLLATSGAPTGFATSTAALPAKTGIACVADTTASGVFPNFETAPYSVVDATHIQLTLNKVHFVGATVAVGGLCGYGLEQTVDTTGLVRQVFPVVGSLNGTQLYYAGALTGVVGYSSPVNTSGYLNVSAPVTSAVRQGGTVTLTMASSLPYDLNGLSLTVSGVSDASFNGTFTVNTTGGNTLTYANAGADSTSSGGAVGVLTGGYNLFPMAEVLSVASAGSDTVDGTMTLAPNTVAWAPGDLLEEPHYHQQLVDADTELITQYVPRPLQYSSAGKTYLGNVGPGTRGWQVMNGAPTNSYLGAGGTHQPPDSAFLAGGVWRNTMEATAGQESLLRVHCNLHGCNRWDSAYALLSMDSHIGQDFLFYDPNSDTASWNLAGTGYTFSPGAFSAPNIQASTVSTGSLMATGGSVSGLSAFSLGASGASGNFVWRPDGTHYGIYSDPWFGINDGSKYVGVAASLPAPSGTTMVGGYYMGMGVGGASANTNTPIFGVLNSAQSGSGLGNVAMTITDSNVVQTLRNTLDDGNGNMGVVGRLVAVGGLASGTAGNTDLVGTVVLNAGATSVAYNFAGGYSTAPVCTVQPQNATPAAVQALSGYVAQVTTGGLRVNVGAGPGSSVVFGYTCVARN